MATLDGRLKELERAAAKPSEACFWCECQRPNNEAPAASVAGQQCAHAGWKQVPHEVALAELN